MVTAATIYLSLLGAEGLARVASASHQRTAQLVERLTAIDGVAPMFAGPHFHETALVLDRPVGPVLASLAARDILGGHDLSTHFPELGHGMLVCATETKTEADLDLYAAALSDVMST